jgi:hypothetical protein
MISCRKYAKGQSIWSQHNSHMYVKPLNGLFSASELRGVGAQHTFSENLFLGLHLTNI